MHHLLYNWSNLVLLTRQYDGFCFSFYFIHGESYFRDVNLPPMGWPGVWMIKQWLVFGWVEFRRCCSVSRVIEDENLHGYRLHGRSWRKSLRWISLSSPDWIKETSLNFKSTGSGNSHREPFRCEQSEAVHSVSLPVQWSHTKRISVRNWR